MKRLLFILFFFSTLLMCGCERKYNILEYQSKDISAKCTVNERFEIQVTKKGGVKTVSVISPEEIKGVTFEVGEKIYVSANGEKIAVERENLKGICALSEMFSQDEECMTSAKSEKEGSVLTFQKEECVYRVVIGKNSLPSTVQITSADFEYRVQILAISLLN